MAVLQAQFPTLADHASRLDPNGKVDVIVQMLSQKNEILDDMVWMESNEATAHTSTIQTGLPQGTWRKAYQGVQPTKGETAQIKETMGNLEGYAEVDKMIADLNGNTNEFRLSESKGFLEGLSQQMAQTLIYGNDAVDNSQFTGLAARFNTVNPATAKTAQNVIDAGGTGSDNTSVWLVGWSQKTICGLFPKGQKAGLNMEDKGQQTIVKPQAEGGGMYEAYRSHYQWQAGLLVRDWRYAVRICNIDVSDLRTSDVSRKALIALMTLATETIESLTGVKPVWYMNRTVRAMLRQGIVDKIAYNLTTETVAGKVVTMFDGIPVRRVDQILNTEARVV